MNSKRMQRGFTLIELLVVIAIIAILSSVVLANLSATRQKGNDASVRSNLNNARAAAELFRSNNGDAYVGGTTPNANDASDVCSSAANAGGIKGIYQYAKAAADASGVTLNTTSSSGSNTTATCHSNPNSGSGFSPATAWALEVPLKSSSIPNAMFCVDSSGTASTTSGFTLAGSDAKCY